MEIMFFTQHMMVMGGFFLNGYKEEYPNCKFPTFNSGKTIERQVERAFMNNMSYGGPRVNGFSGGSQVLRFSGSGP
jgi:hypothetical protein